MYKISYMDISVQMGVQPLFYNDYKWSVIFKNYETIPYIYNLHNIAHQLYVNKKHINTKWEKDLNRHFSKKIDQ